MAKYSAALKDLPKIFNTEPSRQSKVQELKARLRLASDFKQQSAYLAHRYTDLRARRDLLDNALFDVNLELDAVIEMMAEQFDADSLSRVTLDDGTTVSVYTEPYAQVIDRETVRQWCIAQGLEQKMMLPHQTLTSLMKQRLEKGEDMPPGLAMFSKVKARRTGAGKNETEGEE